MIILKVFVLAFVVVHAVLAESVRGRTRYADQGYSIHSLSVNRPPAPEIYEAIPVSVVYEDRSSRGDKSIKSGIETTNNLKPVEKKEEIKSETIVKNEIGDKNTSNLEPVKVSSPKEVSIVSNTENKTKKSESTPSTYMNQEQQIPVAVIYDLESSFTVDTSTTSVPTPNRMQANRRKVQRPSMAEKTIDKEPFETRMTDHKDDQKVAKVDMKQQSVKVSENSQEGKEKQVVVKENHGTHRSGNSQTFPKRDNSTGQHEFVPIIQSENVVFSHSGNFMYSYEGGDGTKAFENGRLKTYEDDNAGEAVSGGFSYMDKDGKEYSLSYTADEKGYRPVGAHLPTPPPIPPAIARALAYLATKTTPEPVTESLSDEEH